MERKIQQHYVWEYYLRAWCFNSKQLYCYRILDEKIFLINPEKTAKEREFYRLKEITPKDEYIIYNSFIKGYHNEEVERLNLGWVNTFKQIFKIRDDLKSKGVNNVEIEKEIETTIINMEEDYHTQLEQKALPFLEALRNEDTNLFSDEEGILDFCLFLCTQYFRTKRMKMSVLRSTEEIAKTMGIDVERMWNILSHIFATNMAYSLIMRENFKWTLLTNNDGIPFISGDQPIINSLCDYSVDKPPESLELYYPVSPNKALLISDTNYLQEPSIVKINDTEINKYNSLILGACEEQIYSVKKETLEELMETLKRSLPGKN